MNNRSMLAFSSCAAPQPSSLLRVVARGIAAVLMLSISLGTAAQAAAADETAPAAAKVPVAANVAAAPLATTPANASVIPSAKDAPTIARIKAVAEQRIGGKASSIRRMPFGGLWEVLVDGEIFYVDANVDYVIAGRIFDAKNREDLTERAREDLMRVDVKALPLELAVKTVKGDGSRVLVTFEDPNCGYCKRLQRDIDKLKNVTIYTFLYPILSPDSVEKSKAIWCSKEPAAAWREFMTENKAPAAAPADCKAPVEQVVAIGQKLSINGTPTLFFADGRRVTGAVPNEKIEQKLADAAKAR